MVKGYLTTKDLCERYKVERTTLYRWMKREENPLPAPRISGKAGLNRWAIDDIEAYEASLEAA
ncbi:helix-turn-helix transcriptional regulator [Vreelandella aquamarina]|uniref:helix-turn-helix transcriptional regulator n=1 Tax=Vreelandella aquamarina TaxID=77097 RepID=UPI0007807A55|nr:helix-turn-helix domain-containing protein [Halomonas axialensis]